MLLKILSFLTFLQISQKVLAINLTKEQEQSIPIFEPFPITIINPISVCKESLTSSIAPFSLDGKDFVAISLTVCDLLNPIIVFRNKLDKNGKTQGIILSHQQKYIWASHSTGKFFGIDIQKQPFNIFIQGNSDQNQMIYKIYPWLNNNDILFLVCNQQFQIFDWRIKENGIKLIKSVNVDTVNAKKIKFFRNNQYALVATPFKGVLFYKVDNGDDIDKINFTYSCVLKPTFFDVSDFQIIDDDTIAVMMVYTGVFMHNMKNYFDNQGQSCPKGIFPLLAQTPAQGYGGNIYLTKDRKYLFAQYRTVGIKIYDVSNKSLQIIQEIKVVQNSKDIVLNNQENLLYYSNSVSLQIFKRTKPNFNRDLPNLLLNSYQLKQYTFYKESASGSYDFSCLWREDKKQLFIQRSSWGAILLKYSGQGILEETSRVYSTPSEFSLPDIQFLPDGIRAYYPRLSAGFSIVDFTIPEQPKILKEKITLDYPTPQFSFFKFFKTKPLGIVSNLQNAIIFSIEDPLNPVTVRIIDTFTYTLGELSLQTMYLNKEEDTVFFIVSTYGIIVVDITNPAKDKLLSTFFTDGASDIKLTSDNKHALIAANYAGFIIAEYNSDKQLIFLSKTQVNGNCYKILQFEGDQFVLVTSYEDPTISLISISDVKNPRVIQRMGDPNIFAYYQMCISKDKSELFVTGQYALYHLQIQPQIILHTQMYVLISLENSNEFTRTVLESGISLKVGQKIELHLVPIYQTLGVAIRRAFYYDEYVLQELPSWMNFFPTEKILRLDVSKNSLKKNDAGQFIDTISQVVFLTYSALSKNSFINTYFDINPTDSANIYKACQKEGYLDSNGFLQETYTPTKEFNLGSKEETYLSKWLSKISSIKQFIQQTLNQNFANNTALSKNSFINTNFDINQTDSENIYLACQKEGYLDSNGFLQGTYSPTKEFNLGAKEETYLSKWSSKIDLVKQLIQYILNQNIVNYTTQLKISLSLLVDFTNQNQYIQTLQEEVIIKMVIVEQTSNNEILQQTKAKFVKRNYSGVLVLISDKQDEIKLEGSLKNINLVLQSGIKFALEDSDINNENIFVQITVSDNVNYNYENLMHWRELPILSQQSQIAFQPELTLQKDLYSKYPKGELFIQESFSYQISSNVFTSKDEPRLQYVALLKQGDEYKEIPKDFWLQFSPTDRIFTGIPTAKYYNDKISVQVNVTDGYTYKLDQFDINPNQIPFNYAIQLAIQIFGPIIGLLGLYRYKHLIYNISCKDHYVYTKDIAYVGELYRKQIVITENKRPVALKLWRFFLTRVGPDQLKVQLANEISKPGAANNFQYFNPEGDMEQSVIKQNSFQDEIIKKIYPFGVNSEDVPIVDKKLENVIIQNSQNQQIDNNVSQKNPTITELKDKSQILNDKIHNQSLEKSQLNNSLKSSTQIKENQLSQRAKLKSAILVLQKQMTLEKNNQKIRSNNDFSKSLNYQEQLFQSDGRIDFSKILKFIQQQYCLIQQNKREVSEEELKSLENPNSILSQAIYCFLIEYLINICPTTKKIIDCMQTLAMGYYKDIDWYRAYVNITPQFNDIRSNPFPDLTICEQTVKSALSEIFMQADKVNKITKSKQQRLIFFSLVLIEECLKVKAIGFSFQPNKFLQVTRGESLHTYTHLIQSVKAFERNNSIKCCYKVYQKFDLHYQQKGLTDNDKLPLWIQGIDLVNGTILFGGIPEKKDIGSIIIKVFHQDLYILRSFEIQILQKENEQQQQQVKKQSRQSIFYNTPSFIDNSNSMTRTDYDMNESQQMFRKKKTIDFLRPNARMSFEFNMKSSLVKQNKSSIQNDEIVEDSSNSEKEIKNEVVNPTSPSNFDSIQNIQFRTFPNQNTVLTTEAKPIEEGDGDFIFNDISPKMCKLQGRYKVEQPAQEEDSIASVKD